MFKNPLSIEAPFETRTGYLSTDTSPPWQLPQPSLLINSAVHCGGSALFRLNLIQIRNAVSFKLGTCYIRFEKSFSRSAIVMLFQEVNVYPFQALKLLFSLNSSSTRVVLVQVRPHQVDGGSGLRIIAFRCFISVQSVCWSSWNCLQCKYLPHGPLSPSPINPEHSWVSSLST